eukprot:scaffold91002_cov45-Attheya_sp.AAC.2
MVEPNTGTALHIARQSTNSRPTMAPSTSVESTDYGACNAPSYEDTLVRLDVPAEELPSIAIEYKGNYYYFSDRRDSIQHSDGDIHVEDESEVVALFHAERNMHKLKTSLDLKRERFRAMADFISKKETDVLRKWEDMNVLKIYPCNTPLSTTSNWMGIETGFRKTFMVNRYIGSADGLY